MASTDPQEAEVVVGCDSMLEIAGQVVGISLPLLRRLLAVLGVVWTDLWAPPPVAKPVDDTH